MTKEDLIGWSVRLGVFAIQGTFLYASVRLIILGRPMINPFKNGWSSLRTLYGVAAAPAGMRSTAALIGSITYKGTVSVGFGPDSLHLGRSFLGSSYVSIPYAAVAITHPPRRVTVLRIPFVLDGGFQVRGADVDFTLKTDVAKELIEVLARRAGAAGGTAPL